MAHPRPGEWKPWEAAEIADATPAPRKPRWRLNAAVTLIAVLALGVLAWWLGAPSAPSEPPPSATATGTIAPPPAAPAPAAESTSTRVVTVKTDTFTLTVDRPAAPPPAPATPVPPPLAPVAAANPQPADGRILHKVVRGDTLWAIAERYLGDPARYPELARLSGIRNPDLIYPGDLVTIEKVAPRR